MPLPKDFEDAVASAAAALTSKPHRNKFQELQQNSNGNKNVIKPKTNKIFTRGVHPNLELTLNLPVGEMHAEPFDEPRFLERTLQNVPLHWVDTEDALKEMYEKLKDERILAVDLEHHSFHSYTGLVSLIQISNSTEDFLVDPIKLREALQSPELSLNRFMSDPTILKIFHGAESDIAWLQRDFDTFVVNMFDSYHAAKALNLPRLSLAFLLEYFCGVELDKKYQLADWRERPMPAEMVEYARKDTHYLVHLYHLLKIKLTAEQYGQVLQRSNKQCLVLYAPEPITEKSWKVALDRSNYPLNGDQVALVRRLFYWREWKARELDVSPAALMPNSFLARIAHTRAKTVPELKDCWRNVSEILVKEFPALVEFINSDESKEAEITGITPGEPEAQREPVLEQQKSLHIRFDQEEPEQKKPKLSEEADKPARRKVSFLATTATASAASSGVFLTPAVSEANSGKVLLAGLVRENLPKIEPQTFKTRAQDASDREAAEAAAKAAAEEASKTEEKVNALIHGSNRIVDDLEIVSGGSNSTVLADKLRKNVVSSKEKEKGKGGVTAPAIPAADYTSPPASESAAQKTNEVFDPYNTIAPSATKAAFIEATIAPATAPRLSATRLSGNRMASFTKKRK